MDILVSFVVKARRKYLKFNDQLPVQKRYRYNTLK